MQYLNPQLAGFEKYLPKQRTAMDSYNARSGGQMVGLDAATAGGMIFIQGELEKLDTRINQPLVSTTWDEDIPVVPGGGWIDFTSMLNINYGISGPNLFGLQANQNSAIPIIQADMTKDIFPVFPWQNIIRMSFLDMKKFEVAPRNITQIYDDGVRVNWNFACQEMTYFGMVKLGVTQWTGIINDPTVTTTTVPLTGTQNGVAAGSAASGLWANKTPQQIGADFLGFVVAQATSVAFARNALADTALVPPLVLAYLAGTPYTLSNGTGTGYVSVLDFIEKTNYNALQGVPFKIKARPQCTGAGTGGLNRIVLYRNAPDMIELDIPVVATRALTQMQLEMTGGSYNTLYAGNIGVPKKRYLQAIAYLDGV